MSNSELERRALLALSMFRSVRPIQTTYIAFRWRIQDFPESPKPQGLLFGKKSGQDCMEMTETGLSPPPLSENDCRLEAFIPNHPLQRKLYLLSFTLN